MEHTRVLIREKRLQKYARILTDKYDIDLRLIRMSEIGCCDSERLIFINPDVNPNDSFKNLVLQKALTLHEIGHILYTDNRPWNRYHVDRNIAGIIQDGRVEEGISRLFPKARLYFTYLNREVLPYKDIITFSLEKKLAQLILRESMKNTGAPPMPKKVHKQIIHDIGENDYNWFLERTREAVEAKTEREAARITKQIEDQIRRICGKFDGFSKENSSSNESGEKCGNSSENMPEQTPESEGLAVMIITELEKEAEKNEDNKDDENEKDNDDNKDEDSSEDLKDEEIKEDTNKDDTEIEEETDDEEDENDDDSSNEDNEDDKEDDDLHIEGKNQIPILESSEDDETNGDKDKDNNESGELEYIDSQLNFLESINEQLEREASEEVSNETDIIKSGEAESDFSSYGLGNNISSITGREKRISNENSIRTQELDSIANRLAHTFRIIAQRGNGWSHNQTRGKLEMHKLPTLVTNPDQPRVFKRKYKKEFTDLSVVILLDGSGSMGNLSYDATCASYIVAKSLEIGKYNVEVVQFAVNGSYYDKDVYGIKSFNQRISYARDRFVPAYTGHTTPLLSALVGAEISLNKVKSKRKVIFVITDGMPNDGSANNDGYIKKCKSKINKLETKRIPVIGIMLRESGGYINDNWDAFNLFHQGRKFLCRDIKNLPNQMSVVIKNVLVALTSEEH